LAGPADRGELVASLAVRPADGRLRLAFGTAVTFVDLTAAQARQMAERLLQQAAVLERSTA
jgi:hypothetical protein